VRDVRQPSAKFRIAERRGDAQNLQFRAAKGQSHGKGIVHIVADVGINDDFLGRRRRWALSQPKLGKKNSAKEKKIQSSNGCGHSLPMFPAESIPHLRAGGN
jgi:hypothetical protein